jgi:A/G-specific adenine glycosylase
MTQGDGGRMDHQHTINHRFLQGASDLTDALLAWWEVHGRKDPALKPWMLTKDGRWPEPQEHVSVFECWIAEVMLQPPAVSAGSD